jgi:hypothetical protein
VDQEPVFNAAPLTVRAELQNCTQSSGELSLSFEGQILKQSNNLSLNHVPETAGLYTAKLNFVESGAPKTANLEIDVLDFQTECNIQSLLPSKITASSSNVFQDEALNMKVSPDACDSAVLKEVKYEEGIIDSDGKITWKEIVLPDNLEIHFSGPVLEFSHVFSTAGLVRIRANFFNHLDKKYREVITEDIQVIELLCLDSANGCGPIGNPTM